MNYNPKIYNIPAEQNFFQQLTKGIINKFGATCNLKDVTILLPTKHACESLRQIFLEATKQTPRIHPINDLSGLVKIPKTSSSPASCTESAARPGISGDIPLDRMSLIAKISQMILKLNHPSFSNIIAVTEFAEYFTNFLHNAELYQIDLSKTLQVIDEDLTLHQQELLQILKTLITLWQADPMLTKTEYNNISLKYLADNLTKKNLVIAGISSNIPAIINLMQKPDAHIVFYGLDQHLNKSDWQQLSPNHPQYNFKQILAKLAISPDEVLNWSDDKIANSTFLSEALKPAGACSNWYQLPKLDSSNLSYLSCYDQHMEAKSIIEYLQKNQDKSAIIITNDDALMVKIMLHLNQAKIEANVIRDHPLIQSETAIWLELCLNFIREDFSLISGLALLKHPFAAIDPEILIELELIVRDKNFRSDNIFDALFSPSSSLVKAEGAPSLPTSSSTRTVRPEFGDPQKLQTTLSKLHDNAQNFKQLLSASHHSFKKLLEAHLSFGESIAVDSIWKDTSGEELKLYLDQINQHAEFLGIISGQDYQHLFTHLLKSAYYRQASKPARITLAKPIDARLHTAQLVILAGLNEGVWPTKPTIDPCFNNSLLNKIGLTNQEQLIGEEAYDFQCFASQNETLLTRAEKIDGVITTPSRWLLRILTLAHNLNTPTLVNNHIVGNLQTSSNPAPIPAIEYRPTQFSVTQVEKLVFNPFHIYVDLILGLKKLPPLTKKLSALDFGIFVHKAIEIYERNANNSYTDFINAGKQALNILNLNHPQLKLIYWPRFTRIARWFTENKQSAKEIYLESFGSLKINDNFTLTARADRIEVMANNSINIVDYKTGNLASAKSIYDGQSLQLLLEGLIGLKGGFYFQKKPTDLNKLTYIGLSGGEDPAQILEIDIDEKPVIQQASTYLDNLLSEYQNPKTPYYYTKKKILGYCEYEHLARAFGK